MIVKKLPCHSPCRKIQNYQKIEVFFLSMSHLLDFLMEYFIGLMLEYLVWLQLDQRLRVNHHFKSVEANSTALGGVPNLP